MSISPPRKDDIMVYVIAVPFVGLLVAAKLLRRYFTANDAWRLGRSDVSR